MFAFVITSFWQMPSFQRTLRIVLHHKCNQRWRDLCQSLALIFFPYGWIIASTWQLLLFHIKKNIPPLKCRTRAPAWWPWHPQVINGARTVSNGIYLRGRLGSQRFTGPYAFEMPEIRLIGHGRGSTSHLTSGASDYTGIQCTFAIGVCLVILAARGPVMQFRFGCVW